MTARQRTSGWVEHGLALPDLELLQQLPRHALNLLLRAVRYAGNTERPVWDFAPSLDELRRLDLSLCDLRWLLNRGLVQHARETSSFHGMRRTFDHRYSIRFSEQSAFALTARGVELLQELLHGDMPKGGMASANPRDASADRAVAGEPNWDGERRELRIGSVVIKRFRVPARNQECILSAFQEEAWPIHIDDPLPPVPQIEPKRRLHSAIQCLNRNQKARLLRFHGDGEGLGVRWELLAGRSSSSADL